MQVSEKKTNSARFKQNVAENKQGEKVESDKNADTANREFEKNVKQDANTASIEDADEYDMFKRKYADRIESERNVHVRKSCEKAVAVLTKLDSMLNILAVRYSVNPGDIDGIVRGVMTDPAMNGSVVSKRGCTSEQMTRMDSLERENMMLREQATEFYRMRRNEEMFSKWESESEKIRKLYDPEFDLKREIAADREFFALLKNGVSADAAYYLRHKDEIDETAARKMSEAFAKDVRARGIRPDENGCSNISPTSFSTDVRNLSKKTREDIRRKVKAGEKIYF